MPLVATHNGPFHADDVMAVALLRTFWDAASRVERSRDPDRHDAADVVVDVGGVFDPSLRRFDHHQASYTGDRSSAGMVLDWLEAEAHVDSALAAVLRSSCIDYIDAVDNGRRAPARDVPCFPRIVEALGQTSQSLEEFDQAFETAVAVGASLLTGLTAAHHKVLAGRTLVGAAMEEAEQAGRNVLFFDDYVSWKEPYFELGGATHPTEFVMFPATDGSWRIVAIPPKLGDFGQKRSLPEAWAGLTDDELTAVTGIPGSVFCHKNRFIAVFKTREGALRGLDENGLLSRPGR